MLVLKTLLLASLSSQRSLGLSISMKNTFQAIFLDCDGTIAETEVPITLKQFNKDFEVLHARTGSENGLIQWSESEYETLLLSGDSKQRFLTYFEEKKLWPPEVKSGEMSQLQFAETMQRLKNEQFNAVLEDAFANRAVELRPGIASLVQDAMERGIPVAVCSNSNTEPVEAIVAHLLPAFYTKIRVYGADLMIKENRRKKPAPDIYLQAARDAGVGDVSRCLVVEDSAMGLGAAKAAGMLCVVTKSRFTGEEDFSLADLVCEDLVSSGWSLDRLAEKLLL